MPIRNLQSFIMAIDEEYSMLESLVMLHPTGDNSTNVILPQTFRAPTASLDNTQNFRWCKTASQYPPHQVRALSYLSTNCVSVEFALSSSLLVYTTNRSLAY